MKLLEFEGQKKSCSNLMFMWTLNITGVVNLNKTSLQAS